MAVFTGIGGHIDLDGTSVACVQNWSIVHNSESPEIRCSATRGGTQRIEGIQDWSGSWVGYGHTPPILPGAVAVFNGAAGGTGGNKFGYSGSMRVSQVEITIPIEEALPIEHTVTFEGNGILTPGAVTVADDASINVPIGAGGLKVQSAHTPRGGPAAALSDIHEARSVTITLSKANPAWAGSTTQGWRQRAEAALDAALSINCYAEQGIGWANFPQPNQVHEFQVEAGGANPWIFKWMKVGDLTGIDVPINTDTVVGCTIEAMMCGIWHDTAGTPTVGEIKAPDGTTIWPV